MIDSAIELPAEIRMGLRLPPYGQEVAKALSAGGGRNVFAFGGEFCWARAQRRRASHGVGSALVIPDRAEPWQYRWPAVRELLVAWPDSGHHVYRAKLDLARALIRDGVQLVVIENIPDWIHVRRAAAP